MAKDIRLFLFEPSGFFRQRAADSELRLMPLLLLSTAFLADFVKKSVIFYKIGQSSFKGQADWQQAGSGYFGSVIGAQIGFALKLTLLMVAFHAVGRLLGNRPSLVKLINLSGYCFLPAILGGIAVTLLLLAWLTIPPIDFTGDVGHQLTMALTRSRTYLPTRIIEYNSALWLGLLAIVMLSAYWRIRIARTVVLVACAAGVVEAFDRIAYVAIHNVVLH